MLGQGQQRSVPTITAQARRIVDGQSQIVADLGTWNALQLILMKPVVPFASDIVLGEQGSA